MLFNALINTGSTILGEWFAAWKRPPAPTVSHPVLDSLRDRPPHTLDTPELEALEARLEGLVEAASRSGDPVLTAALRKAHKAAKDESRSRWANAW